MRFTYALAILTLLNACDRSGANQPPVLENVGFTTAEDTALDLALSISDPDGDALTIEVTQPRHGVLVGEGTAWRYTPARDFNGRDSFTVTLSDATLSVRNAVVELLVTPVNDAPSAANDAFAAREDTTLALPFSALLGNDADVDSELTITSVTGAFGGAVLLEGALVRFVPLPDFLGPAGFTYVASDGELTASAVVAITVGGENDAPVAGPDALTGVEDTALDIAAAALLANDSDVEQQTLFIASVGDAAGGTVELRGSTVHFTPTLDLNGGAGFSYTVSDGAATTTAAVTLTLAAVDDAPIATAASAVTAEDVTATIALSASDVDSSALSFSVEVPPVHGTVVIVGRDARYTPALNYAGADQFSVRVSDGHSSSAPVVIAVSVTDVIECGDGVLEGGEGCDDGNQVDSDACLHTCVAARCGDSVLQAGVETCDDGNQSNADACLTTCAAASCGDTFVQAGVETCDDGNQSNTDACLTTCAAASCGDAFVRAGVETCDDGNQSNADACLTTCAAASCGDTFVRTGVETCDDGNQSNTDACLTTCAAASCGDTFVQAGVETCDDGNQSNTDACLTTCAA
ncbi:MAG: Ig-like domain-containing protein, partial [Archangium sp.]|nr:Ig-like domain-containing protein [Archangium sp.]